MNSFKYWASSNLRIIRISLESGIELKLDTLNGVNFRIQTVILSLSCLQQIRIPLESRFKCQQYKAIVLPFVKSFVLFQMQIARQ